MKKSKQLLSLAVISLEEGQQIGNVKGLVINPAGKKLAALIIEQKGWFKEQRFIPYHKVHSIGSNAVTIEKSSCVEKGGALSEIVKLLKDRVSISGSKLVAENGTILGYVDEYYIDLTTGAITGLEFSGNLIDSVIKGRAFLDAAYVRTLGKEVAIVTNEGIENIFRLDGGLQETVKNIKESTGHIWENTFKRTKELSTSINKKVKREKNISPGSGAVLIDKPASLPANSDINDAEEISRPEDRSEKQLNAGTCPRGEESVDNIVEFPTGADGTERDDLPYSPEDK